MEKNTLIIIALEALKSRNNEQMKGAIDKRNTTKKRHPSLVICSSGQGLLSATAWLDAQSIVTC